ncbi:MAG: ATP-binding protein, partial [Lutimonas sp.]
DDDFHFVGSTNNEEFLSRKDTTAFFKATADQLAGKAELRNTVRNIDILNNDLVMITDVADAYVLSEGNWFFYSRFRFTSLLKKKEIGWRFIYQHFSAPDAKAEEGETLGTQKITKENQELKEAIKRRTVELEQKNRELQIETALERIRAQVTAMKDSTDLLDIVVTMRTEFVSLGHEAHYFWHMRWLPETYEKAMTSGDGTRIGMVMTLPRHIHGDIKQVADWEKGKDSTHILAMGVNEAVNYVDKMITLGDFEQVDPQAPTLDDVRHIGGLTFVMARTTHGEIGFSLPGKQTQVPEDDLKTLVRFAGVFDLAYKRFEDLKSAERQFREAQIEAALERVRSRSMGMHQSEELKEVVKVIFDQLALLNINAEHAGIVVDYEPKKDWHFWIAETQDIPAKITVPYLDLVWDLQFTEAKEQGKDFFTTQLDFEEKNNFYQVLLPHIEGLTDKVRDFYFKCPGLAISTAIQKDIGLYIENFTGTPYAEEENDILKRFASVFQQTYTRFLDLQKAEAQSREAEIELALERVRSRTMAMHKSEELSETASVLFEQLRNLGGNLWGTGFGFCEKNSKNDEFWFANENGVLPPVLIPHTKDPAHQKMYRAWEQKSDFLSVAKGGQSLKQHYEYMLGLPEVRPFFQDILDAGLLFPDWQEWNAAYFSHGFLLVITTEPYKDKDILKRFAKVFEQAYTRFLDLQKAEAQVREAMIEAALERVRSKTMAMHNSEDVKGTVITLFDEVMKLGLDKSIRCGIGILEGNEKMETWSANAEANSKVTLRVGLLDMTIHPMLVGLKKAWESGQEGYKYTYTKEDVRVYYEALNNEPDYPFNANLETVPEKEFHNSYFFSSGIIFAFTENQISEEGNKVLKRFASVFDQTYTRFLDLQKAEAQAREAQIEAALEKVRSRSLAMHHSEELADVSYELVKQVKSLGIDTWGCAFNIYGDNESTEWFSSITGSMPKYKTPREGIFLKYYNAGQDGETLLIEEIDEEKCAAHYDYLCTLPIVGESLLKAKAEGVSFPSSQIDHAVFMKYGYLLFITFKHVPEAQTVFKRFAKVFEQSYTRFLDLQKAEAQTKEAKIEMALEKVRAQAMAMHHTDDLGSTIKVYFEQLDVLFDTTIIRCGAGLLNKENKIAEMSTASRTAEGEAFTVKGTIDMQGHPLLDSTYAHWLEQKEHRYTLRSEEIGKYYQYITNQVAIPQNKGEDELHFYFPMFPEGSFYVVTEQELPIHELELFRRFSSVLSLTYRRFNDLQKAESQAREAQIEAALERVRSRTMAMQHSEELVDVALVLRTEMGALGVEELETSSIYVLDEKSGNTDCWYAIKVDQDTNPKLVTDHMTLRLQDTWVGKQMLSFYRSDMIQTSIPMKGDHRKEWIDYCSEHSHILTGFYGEHIPERTYHLNKFSNGFLGAASTGEISDESWMLLERATKVFSLVYTRFRDLQQAEAQAKEALKAASLDRLRAEIASMRSTLDLDRIIPLLWRELNTLGIPFIRCGVLIIHEKKKRVHTYLSNPQGESLAVWESDFHATPLIQASVENWKKQEVYLTTWDKDAFISFSNSLVEQGLVKDREKYMSGKEAPEHLVLHMVPFKQGMFYVGSTEKLNEEQLDLVKQTSKAFSVAYARYEDFTNLELAKGSAEKALKDLESAQEQLIQQEKLASLGQLTAGIAHEIKNPLNFVNNFSDLSRELIDDVFIELESLDDSEIKKEITAILEDVKNNLAKVHEHGTRADGIVTSMLQHSRASGSKREAYDFNALVKEFVNLSYHGMRAGKAPINVKIDLDLGPEVGQVNLISEDFSRVILNLCNNAFDAMRDKLNTKKEADFLPHLTIRTQRQKNKVILSIKDNGPGIPDEIKDKILQPFFTTKKGTEGTGLGLSITHDIIKAHGGELKVETTVGQSGSNREAGTVFNIHLPI